MAGDRKDVPTDFRYSGSAFLSVAGRDVIFGRILHCLPGPLKDSLIAAELDDPAVLLNYPRSSPEGLESVLREERAGGQLDPGSDNAPSGAQTVESGAATQKPDHSGVVLVDGSLSFSVPDGRF